MTKTKNERIKKRKQELLDRNFAITMIANAAIVMIIVIVALVNLIEASGNNESEDERKLVVYESHESEVSDHDAIASSANTSNMVITTLENKTVTVIFDRNLSEDDKYLLAKIAMAEAEGESFETKVCVILTILNRVSHEYFPDTIGEVIFQNDDDIYQFSPVIPGGRWWKIEPNEECWKAVEAVNKMEKDISGGALYFESCEGESWHSRNLEFILEIGNMRFYK